MSETYLRENQIATEWFDSPVPLQYLTGRTKDGMKLAVSPANQETMNASPSSEKSVGSRAKGGSVAYLTWICVVASLGGFLFGYDTAVISGTFESVEQQFVLSKVEVGWFGSSALLGCILGAACAGWLGDRYGRKPVLIWSGVFFFVSALYSTIPRTFTVLILARALGGIGVGMASVLAPMFISEFSPPRIRGRLVALYQVSIGLGILAAYLMNYLLLEYSRDALASGTGGGPLSPILIAEVWRGMFGMEMIPAALFTVFLFFVPESPRFLAKAGKAEKALAVLTRIDGAETARGVLAEIRSALDREEGTVRELFRPGLRKALLLGMGLAFFGQLTGVNAVIYYGPTILREAGLESGSALLYQVALGTIGLTFTLFAVTRMDTWGRRPLLVYGMVFVTLSMGATAVLMLIGAPAIWIVVLLGVYMACLALSICSVIWVLTPEIFPNRVRGRGSSIATFTTWTTNAAIAFAFPWYVNSFGMHAAFFTFAAICCVATVFFWKLTPETRGRSLEEIEQQFLNA
jgi:SP family arabinose:H+ symporter-like MFS transporter